jgi:hypothetical protein
MSEICNIEPADRKEVLLKGILEKLAQGGGGGGGGGATSVTLAASGDNLSGDISLADLKTALSNGVVLLSFPTEGDSDVRAVVEYTDDSTNGLEIGVFGEDEYIIYSVVGDGNDGVTLTAVSTKYMAESLLVVPTFTSQTGGTMPAGTYAKLKQIFQKGGTASLDVSAMFGLPAGKTMLQTSIFENNLTNQVALMAVALTTSGGTTRSSVYELDISSNDTFTVQSA